MAITSIGYDGSVDEGQWARMVPLVGSAHYGVSGTGDWKVTPHATMDRGINIATGSGWGHGVLDTSSSTVSLQGGVVGSGSRWDMVVARRNWSGTGGSTTFQLVPGSSAKVLPGRNDDPGVLDDQPIALVRFQSGQTAPQEIVDLRCWGRNGGMTARDELTLSYLKLPGASVFIGDNVWNCTLDTNGNAAWNNSQVVGRIPLFGTSPGSLIGSSNPQTLVNNGQQFLIQAGTNVATSDPWGYARLTFQKPFPNGLITVVATNGDDWSTGGSVMFASAGGSAHGASGFGAKNDWVYSVLGQPGANLGGTSMMMQRTPNKIHRINWIAIGW